MILSVPHYGDISGKDLEQIQNKLQKLTDAQAQVVVKLQTTMEKKIGEYKTEIAQEKAKLKALKNALPKDSSSKSSPAADSNPN